MEVSLENQTGDKMDSEAFSALWTNLQNNYEGTNITRTVARLLHMYQPEDGILAYERLLRTLYVLLEDFDKNGFRLLSSMVPPPKNISESTIQEIFQKSTGFSRLIPQTSFVYSSKVDQNEKKIDQSSRFSTKKVDDSEKFHESQTDPMEFRGFPSNEICNTQIRVQNINQFYEPINYLSKAHICNHNTNHQTSEKNEDKNNLNSPIDYRMKWIYTPYLLRKNAICQSNQFYQDPLVIFQTPDQKHLGVPISQINQFQRDHSHKTQECLRNSKKPIFIDLSNDQDKINLSLVNNSNNVQESNKKEIEIKFQEEIELNEEEKYQLEEEVKIKQRAIQEDIFKMDVVQINFLEPNSTISQTKNLELDLEINNELKKSIGKFLERVKNEETISPPVVQKQKETQKTVSDETSAFIDCWKKIITRSVLGRDPKSSSSDSDKSTDFSKENNYSMIENNFEVKKEIEKKIRRKKPNPPTRPKSERVAQRIPNRIENQFSSSSNNKKKINNSNKELEESNLSFQTKTCLNSINMLQQANSISELATYKKQYYDALLSIQRAKVAVANSLAISSVGNSTGYDPYYFNYLHRQQQLVQHQRFLLGTQFSTQRPLVSNNQNPQNSWTNNNDWRYPSFGQFRFRHSHPVYQSPMNSSALSDNFYAQNSTIGENQCDQRSNIKRKKLEDIVGELKETENINKQNSSY